MSEFEFSTPEEILEAIEEILKDPPSYDPERSQMEAIWDGFRRPSQTKPGGPSAPPAPKTTSTKRAPPIVGVRVQRSSAQHRKEQE